MLGSFAIANKVQASTMTTDRVRLIALLSSGDDEAWVSSALDAQKQEDDVWAHLWRQVRQPVRWRVVPDFLLI